MMVNSVDPEETARYESSHQDLHCLQRYVFLDCRDGWVNPEIGSVGIFRDRITYSRTNGSNIFGTMEICSRYW